jgi:hypothetical protein
MALLSDAVMVLYWTIEGDNTDHDDWHTYEHMHERLSIPGFLRGTRWVARLGPPSYLAVYEVSGVDVATSAMYLARLNDPTPWTTSTMSRVRGMNRGFCTVAGSSGYGLGSVAFSIRFSPVEGRETEVRDRLARQVLPAMASRRGLTSVHLLAGRRRPRHHDEASVPRTNVACGFPALRSTGRLPARRRAASSRMKFRRR